MAGLALLKIRPYVDTTRIGVSGWSYGGFMTTWLIGHYSGWKAAMAGAAVIDLVDDYNLNDLSLFIRAYGETLTFPADLALMKEQSPMTYVDNMKTPLLLLVLCATVPDGHAAAVAEWGPSPRRARRPRPAAAERPPFSSSPRLSAPFSCGRAAA